jgi:hypothetical protein
VRVVLIAAVLLGARGVAVACPFCGGKGASGLLENLLIVAGLWFGGRALMRAMKRRQQREEQSKAAASAESAADPRP